MTEKPDILRGWHLQRSVSVGHIVTTMVVATSVIIWLSNIQNDVERNHSDIERLVLVVDGHLGSGPHAEASVRLTRLEVLMEQIRSDVRALTEELKPRRQRDFAP